MGLIAHYAILSYGLPKSKQVYLAKIEFLLQHDSLKDFLPFDTKIAARSAFFAKLYRFLTVRLLVTGKLKSRGITEVRGALQHYHGNNTSE